MKPNNLLLSVHFILLYYILKQWTYQTYLPKKYQNRSSLEYKISLLTANHCEGEDERSTDVSSLLCIIRIRIWTRKAYQTKLVHEKTHHSHGQKYGNRYQTLYQKWKNCAWHGHGYTTWFCSRAREIDRFYP